jgi:hypothetical protein
MPRVGWNAPGREARLIQKMLTVYVDATHSGKNAQLALASTILSMSKIPNMAKVCAYGRSPLLEKVPRNVKLDFIEGATFTDAYRKDLLTDKSELVFVASNKHVILPEALGCACAAFQSMAVDYVQLEDVQTNHAVMIAVAAIRYWKLPSFSSEAQGNFVARASILRADLETFADYDKPFEVLDAVRGRKIGTPLPSLACALPLAANPPPMIQWPAIIQMIEQLV